MGRQTQVIPFNNLVCGFEFLERSGSINGIPAEVSA
jgi:hypothetical protein